MRLSHQIRSAPTRFLIALSIAAAMFKPGPAAYAGSGLTDDILSDIGLSRCELLVGGWLGGPAAFAD